MEVELFTLCDFAEDMGNGKLVIVGTFDIIFVKSPPAVHPSCAIAARIRVHKDEGGKHKLKLSISDSKSSDLIPPIEGEFSASLPNDRESTLVNFAINIGQLKLSDLGKHMVNLIIDGQTVSSLPFYVEQR